MQLQLYSVSLPLGFRTGTACLGYLWNGGDQHGARGLGRLGRAPHHDVWY